MASANVVGYQERPTGTSGWTVITGTFKNIGVGVKTLSDVTVNDVWDPTGDNIQFLDEGGGTRVRSDSYQAVYTYLNADWASSMGTTAGWYQVDALMNDGLFLPPEENDDFSYGAGAVVQTGSTEAGLTCSGEVPKGPQTILAVKSGWNIIGNPLPIDMTLSDVTANDVWDPTGDNIQFLDEGGGTRVRSDSYQAVYTYLNADWASSMGTTAGWYQVDALMNDGLFLTPEESDNDIKAGSAFIVQTSSDSSGVQFKAALPLE